MIRRFIKVALLAGFIGSVLSIAWAIAFVYTPIALPHVPFRFSIAHGSSLKSAARQIGDSGLPLSAWQFELLARLTGTGRALKAGTYELAYPVTPLELLAKLKSGEALLSEITFIEGHTFIQMRKTLDGHAGIKHDSAGLSSDAILREINAKETNPEGLFFPDTYVFSGGIRDIVILKRAYQTMQINLARVWEKRAPNLPYETPYQALIMASIIEKETGKTEERPRIAAVFVNRLKRGMKLQTDPTVIYGMGERFDGRIRKRDLAADTSYNTYTRLGLPPTPIAMPGLAAIEAALNPTTEADLYFVAKGDGSHYFSRSLEEHNRAVTKYQK